MRSVVPISGLQLTLNQGRLPSFLCLTGKHKKKIAGWEDTDADADDLDANEQEILIDETWTDKLQALSQLQPCIEAPPCSLFDCPNQRINMQCLLKGEVNQRHFLQLQLELHYVIEMRLLACPINPLCDVPACPQSLNPTPSQKKPKWEIIDRVSN